MIKNFAWRGAPLVLAFLFALSYATLIFGVPAILSQFQDFKIEMPALTLWALQMTRLSTSPIAGVALGIMMLSLTFAIAIGEKWAWWIGLALTLLFGLCLFSTVLPLIAIVKSLSGGDDTASPSSGVSWWLIALFLGFSCVPTLLFLAFRRAFWRASQTKGAPI